MHPRFRQQMNVLYSPAFWIVALAGLVALVVMALSSGCARPTPTPQVIPTPTLATAAPTVAPTSVPAPTLPPTPALLTKDAKAYSIQPADLGIDWYVNKNASESTALDTTSGGFSMPLAGLKSAYFVRENLKDSDQSIGQHIGVYDSVESAIAAYDRASTSYMSSAYKDSKEVSVPGVGDKIMGRIGTSSDNKQAYFGLVRHSNMIVQLAIWATTIPSDFPVKYHRMIEAKVKAG